MFTLKSTSGKLRINDDSYPTSQLRLRHHTEGLEIFVIPTGQVLSNGRYDDYLNGDADGTPAFASLEALNTFLDTAFNTGGGNGEGVTIPDDSIEETKLAPAVREKINIDLYDYIIQKIDGTTYAIALTGLSDFSGSDSTVIIQNAINELSSGGSILLRKGLIDDLGKINITNSNITIRGENRENTILKAKDSMDVGESGTFGLINISAGVTGFNIFNIQLDGNGQNQTKIDNGAGQTAQQVGIVFPNSATKVQGYNIKNCIIKSFTRYGVYVGNGFSEGEIENCVLYDNYWNDITLDGSNYNKVVKNTTWGSGDVSICLYSNFNFVYGNTVKNCNGVHGSLNSRWGIASETIGGFARKGNIISSNHVFGADIKMGIGITGNVGTTDTIISNNQIYDLLGSANGGINVSYASGCSIIGNRISDTFNAGILVSNSSNNFFGKNHTTGAGNSYAIIFQSSSGNNVVDGNVLSGFGGIEIKSGCNTNKITNNNLRPSAPTITIVDNGTGTVLKSNYNDNYDTWIPDSLILKTVTASYTLILSDQSKTIQTNVASANNLTVPINSSVAFPIGTEINITSIGAGKTTIVATGGVTINSAGGILGLRLQYSSAKLIKTATDTWLLTGDLG